MQDNNVILEITKQITDKSVIQKDIQDATNLVLDMFRKKYVTKIEDEMKKSVEFFKDNPPKEVSLLNAVKPFLKSNNNKSINNIVNLFTNVYATKNIMPSKTDAMQNIISASSFNMEKDPSVKSDGVYDIDENCLFNISSLATNCGSGNSLILIIILMLFLGSFNMLN